MNANRAISQITLLSFRTFGDYVLKAPFLSELYRRFPEANVTLVTNGKGGQVYPLLDSRLRVIPIDRADGSIAILKRLLKAPRADQIYAMDDSRTTLLLALLLSGKRKTGWVQGISRLYADGGYLEWKSVRWWLSLLCRWSFDPARIRRPEDQYEGDVELELLGVKPSGQRLAEYRSRFACPPATRAAEPYIYCAAEAGWKARQLTDEQWKGILSGLLEAFPHYSILVHGAPEAVRDLGVGRPVISYRQGPIRQLFETISASDLVIAPDSFALHLASLYDVPAIGYFGPAHPHRFRPTGPGSRSLFREPECSPCLQRRGESRCCRGFTQCISLTALQPADFVAAAEAALAHRGTLG